MPLRYGLIENRLHNNEGYIAVTTDVKTVDMDQIIEQMTCRGSTVTKAEILGVWEEFEQAVAHFVQQGCAVKTPLFTVRPKVTGSFDSPGEVFLRPKHSVKVNIQTGSRLKNLERQIHVERILIDRPAPSITSITDLSRGTRGNSLTIGQPALLAGRLLKITPHDQSGIFFVNDIGGEIKVPNVAKNKPSELIFVVPPTLSHGKYSLEIRTVLKNHTAPICCRAEVGLISQ
ncbi:MAG: DNA-binding domain-containing protein [Breznakibacter sp.]